MGGCKDLLWWNQLRNEKNTTDSQTHKSADEIIANLLMLQKELDQETWKSICENTDAKLLLEIPEFQKNLTIDRIEHIKSVFHWEIGHLHVYASAFKKGKDDLFDLVLSKFPAETIQPIFSKHGGFNPPYDGVEISFKNEKIFVRIKQK